MKKIFILIALLTFGVSLYAADRIYTYDEDGRINNSFLGVCANKTVTPMFAYQWADENGYMQIRKISLLFYKDEEPFFPHYAHFWKNSSEKEFYGSTVQYHYFWLGTEDYDEGLNADFYIVVIQRLE